MYLLVFNAAGKLDVPKVTLQAMKEEPPLNAKCKDKFVFQSMLIPPEKTGMSLRDLVRPFQHIPVSGLI